MLLGDSNIHTDNLNNPLARGVTFYCGSFEFQHYICVPLHSEGHNLDLIYCYLVPNNSLIVSAY